MIKDKRFHVVGFTGTTIDTTVGLASADSDGELRLWMGAGSIDIKIFVPREDLPAWGARLGKRWRLRLEPIEEE